MRIRKSHRYVKSSRSVSTASLFSIVTMAILFLVIAPMVLAQYPPPGYPGGGGGPGGGTGQTIVGNSAIRTVGGMNGKYANSLGSSGFSVNRFCGFHEDSTNPRTATAQAKCYTEIIPKCSYSPWAMIFDHTGNIHVYGVMTDKAPPYFDGCDVKPCPPGSPCSGPGGGGGGGCLNGGCGTGGGLFPFMDMVSPGFAFNMALSAANVGRYWLPSNRLLNSSFSPGHFSALDSQLHVFPEGSAGATISYMDVLSQRMFSLTDAQSGPPDGIYEDYGNKHIKQLRTFNSSGVVTADLQQIATAEITHWSGYVEKYEFIDLDPGSTQKLYAGRLTKRIDRDGRELVIAYKTWTQAQIDAAPDRQWQINTATDPSGFVQTFTYDSVQRSGRWCVTQISRNDGVNVTYQYDTNNLLSVTHPGGEQSTFSYGQDPVAQTATATVKTATTNGAVTKTVHLTNDYMTLSQSGQAQVVNQPVGITRLVVNPDNEVQWMHVPATNPQLDQRFLYVGGNMGVSKYGNESAQVFDTWAPGQSGPNDPYNGIVGSMNYQVYGAQPTASIALKRGEVVGWTAIDGSAQTFNYDSSGNITKTTFTADNTFEEISYNAMTEPTRRRTRAADVELYEYDAVGHLTKVKTGLEVVNGVDTPTSEYAEITYEYHPSTHVNKGLLKAVMGPLYSAAAPTLHRTEFEYNTKQQLTKITGPADTTGGARPVVQYAYDTAGQVTSMIDPKGLTTSYAYDSLGRLKQTTFPDATTCQALYGPAGSGGNGGSAQLLAWKDRLNNVTTYEYDSTGRRIKETAGAAIDSNILDGQAIGGLIADPNLKNVAELAYMDGSEDIVIQSKANGTVTDYYYDYQNRPLETVQRPRVGVTLSTRKGYSANQLLYDEDPYGRRKYYGYRASDGTLIRTITCTVPEQSFASFTAVWNQTRDLSANAKFIIHDAIRDNDGHLTQVIDGRGNETRYEYDSRGREINKREAFGTSIEARTQTLYDAAGNVVEVRTPRYFDATDTNGSNKAREQWTYNGRGLVATHTEAPGTTESATESFTYDLMGKQLTHNDFNSSVWTTIDNACCGKQIGSQDPLGHGSIRNSDSLGRAVHSASVSDITTHTDFTNPIDAKTLGETTTKYDNLGRVVATTTWLTARGIVDVSNPPIAGLGGVPFSQGLTTFYFYDNNLSDGVGLDAATGVSVLKQSGANPTGSFNVSLAGAITKLADTQANGGAGITFNATSPARASVTVNSEDEVNFSITDASGRGVMSGKLDNYKGTVNALVSWSCQLHDATSNLAGYGTLLESRSIDPLGNATKQRSDAAGRTLRSLDQLDNATVFTYDASGNQLSVRDPNNVGADMVYDQLGRNTSRTDTQGDVTSTIYDRSGNAIRQTDAKTKFTTIAFDARGRRKSTTDRISAVTSFTYRPGGQLLSLTDAENQTTSYTYDARGAKLTEQYPDHTGGTSPGNLGYGIVTFVYDNAGRVLRKQDQQGDTVTFNYDLAGRMSSRDFRLRVNSPSGTIADSDVFTYDRAGRVLTAYAGRYGNTVTNVYDSVGRKASEALQIAAQTYTVGINYNARGELTKYTYPDGSIVDRTYHATGNLHQVKLAGATLDTRTYDAGGRMATSTYQNGVASTWTYRNDNLVTSINSTSPGGTPTDGLVANLAYTWDANKNKLSEVLTGVNATVNGYGFNAVDTTYDFEDRLTQWKRANGAQNQSWNLTAVGDWQSQTVNGTATSRTHGPTHELTAIGASSLSYDAKGNLTQDTSRSPTQNYVWDYDNKMRSADIDGNGSADVSFEYDALGRRVARTQGANAVVYFQVDQQTICDYPRGGAAASPTYRYFWGSYIDELIARKATGTGGAVLFAHRNQQYSIYAYSNSSGAVVERIAHTAYGQPSFMNAAGTVQSTSPNSIRYSYTGREWDASLQLHHFRARWMGPVTGRFLGRDPVKYESRSFGLYEFLKGDPNKYLDADGRLFGFRYGRYCGFLPRGPGVPIDSLDRACMLHDLCLANASVIFMQPCRSVLCQQNLCSAAWDSLNFNCVKEHPIPPVKPRADCLQAALKIVALCTQIHPGVNLPVVPINPWPPLVDTDGDGVPDIIESKYGTNPNLKDTDGDGVSDASDVYPLDPSRWELF